MSEHRYILPTKNFDYIFFGLLALVGAVRLISGIHGVDLGIWFFQNIQFIFLPVFICMMLYRVNLYYQNIFIRTRYINENVWKKNYLKECMLMSAFVIFRYYSLLLRGNINFLYCHAAIVCSFCDDLYDISTVKLFSIFQV